MQRGIDHRFRSKVGFAFTLRSVRSKYFITDKGEWIGKERLRWAKLFNIPMAESIPPGFPANTIKVRISQHLPRSSSSPAGSEGFDCRGCPLSRELGRHTCCYLSCIICGAERSSYPGEPHAYFREDIRGGTNKGNLNKGRHRILRYL